MHCAAKAFSGSVASSSETPRKGAAPQATTAKPLRGDEVLDPHGEERGNAVRLESRGHELLPDSRQASEEENSARATF
jgi:hypothetical protein